MPWPVCMYTLYTLKSESCLLDINKLILVNAVDNQFTVSMLPDGFSQMQDFLMLFFYHTAMATDLAIGEVTEERFHWVKKKKKNQQVLWRTIKSALQCLQKYSLQRKVTRRQRTQMHHTFSDHYIIQKQKFCIQLLTSTLSVAALVWKKTPRATPIFFFCKSKLIPCTKTPWGGSSPAYKSLKSALLLLLLPPLAACLDPGVGTSPLFIAIHLPRAHSSLC